MIIKTIDELRKKHYKLLFYFFFQNFFLINTNKK